jgi:hypothetical protein
MPKINKINPKTFQKEVNNFQNKIRYSNRGECLQIAACVFDIKLTPEQTSYIHSVMAVSDRDYIDYGKGYAEIPVELLFTLMTPFAVDCYKKKNSYAKAYMVGVTERCIKPLQDIIWYKSESKGQCRSFAIVVKFIQEYFMAQHNLLNKVVDLNKVSNKDKLFNLKKSGRGIGFENIDRLNPVTVAAVDKIRSSRFVFDAQFYNSLEGKALLATYFPENSEHHKKALASLNGSLRLINKYATGPQYHDSFHLQGSGRVHTAGGCIQMPKWFRNRFILPVNPNSIRMEFDLKCAQLLILTDILKQPKLKETIIDILNKEGSIWPRIGCKTLDKQIKKSIIYSFCFGAEIHNIPFLARDKAFQLGLNIPIDKKMVEDCLSGILKPLAEAREIWLKNYKTLNIIKNKDIRVILNSLGYKFALYQKAINYVGEGGENIKPGNTKIGSQLLAHLCQGEEQNIIQHLIANHVNNNILIWSYDGFLLEVDLNEVNSLIETLVNNCSVPLEYEII